MTTIATIHANAAGYETAVAAKAGLISPEEVGDRWQEFADNSHEEGVAFLASYDAAGGPR